MVESGKEDLQPEQERFKLDIRKNFQIWRLSARMDESVIPFHGSL